MKRNIGFGCTAALMANMLVSPAVYAQDQSGNNASTNTESEVVAQGDIVVTATRRQESAQNIPLSITAMGGLELQKKGVESFADYGNSVPNLSYGATGDGSLGSRGIAIRGIQGAGATGLYIDDTPVPDSLDPHIVDLARIEVLRGPQGTLYGARSMGGTVRLITRQPESDTVAGFVHSSLSFTRRGGANIVGDTSVNMPIVRDKVGLSVQAFYERDEGVFDKLIGTGASLASQKNIDDLSSYGAQITLRVQPSSALSLSPRVIFQHTKQDGFPFADISPDNFVQRRDFDIAEGGKDKWALYSLTTRS